MTFLNREKFAAAAANFSTSVVSVPEWGGDVRLRALSLGERVAFTKYAEALGAAADPVSAYLDAMMRLVLVSIVDDAGNRVFQDDEAHILGSLDFRGFAAVRDAARELNGMVSPPAAESEEEASPLAG